MIAMPLTVTIIAWNVPLLASGSIPVSCSNQSMETSGRAFRYGRPQPSWGGPTMPPRSAPPTAVPLDGLEWRQVGPLRGGRVEAVAGDPRDRNTFDFGSSGGAAR